MMLLTKKLRSKLPPLYTNEKVEDPLVIVKFFDPMGRWKWYAIEFDGVDTFYGLVKGFETELGYFSLTELSEFRGKLGLGIERDIYFEPKKLSEVR